MAIWKPRGLSLAELGAGQVGRDDAVEDDATDALREEPGVGGAEERAVGLAEVVQLRVADGGPQDVHVAGGVGRREVLDEIGVVGLAAGGHRLGLRQQRLLLGGVVGRRVGREEAVERLVAEAVDRVGAPDAARVETDEVVVATDVRPADRVGPAADVVDAGRAGAARVDERASPAAWPGRGP